MLELCRGFSTLVLFIIIAVHVVKHQSVINKYRYMQKAGEPENDAGFHKVIVISAVHVAS